jgi:hypothetical protein
VRRRNIRPRTDWERKVEEVGLIYHHTADGVYWDESVCYELSLAEVERLEKATSDLHQLALEAAQRVIDDQRYGEFAIPTSRSRPASRSCSNTTPTRRPPSSKPPSRSGTGCRTSRRLPISSIRCTRSWSRNGRSSPPGRLSILRTSTSRRGKT